MPKRATEQRLDELKLLAQQPPSAETARALRKALEDRRNVVVAQAATVAGTHQVKELVPDLLSAFDRMMINGVETDPHCRAKLAIINALTRAKYSEPAVFLRGLRHIQMEPVWGGHEDTAPKLRGTCVLALASCTDLTRREVLHYVIEALTDQAAPVRVDAARALEQLEGDECALLLRLKARFGDPHSPVIGQVFESLLNLEGSHGLEFVAGFLESANIEICEEAALAIGSSRLPQAFPVLKDAWERHRDHARGTILLRMVSASGRPEAIDFLLSLIQEGSKRESDAAIKALDLHQDSPGVNARLKDALRKRPKNERA
jgi:HEAT repeat protein